MHVWWNVRDNFILFLFLYNKEYHYINPETNAWYITNEYWAEDIYQTCHIHDTLSEGKTFTEMIA